LHLFAFKETAPRKEDDSPLKKRGKSYEVLRKTQWRTCQLFINGLLEANKFPNTTMKGKLLEIIMYTRGSARRKENENTVNPATQKRRRRARLQLQTHGLTDLGKYNNAATERKRNGEE